MLTSAPPPPIPRANNSHAQPHDEKKMHANINVAMLNINELATPLSNMSFIDKWSMIKTTLNKYKITILALQETHLDQEMLDSILANFGTKMTVVFSSHPTAPQSTAGVAFIINKSLIKPQKIFTHELFAGHALYLEVKWLDTEVTTLINIYCMGFFVI